MKDRVRLSLLTGTLDTAHKFPVSNVREKRKFQIIELCADQIRKSILEACNAAVFFGFIADEATDSSTREQISLCVFRPYFVIVQPLGELADGGGSNLSSSIVQLVKYDICHSYTDLPFIKRSSPEKANMVNQLLNTYILKHILR